MTLYDYTASKQIDLADAPFYALPDRFWAKVNKTGPIPKHCPELGPCWVWTAALNRDGYGVFWLNGRMVLAYHLPLGPVPAGKERDHRCRNRACVRDGHLEVVTHKINMARGVFGQRTHCPWGHPYDTANTLTIKATGARQCRACARRRTAIRRREGLAA